MNEAARVARSPGVRDLLSWDGFLALGFGAGLAPWAPGTFGTLLAVPLVVGLRGLEPALYGAILLLTFGLGIWACGRVGRRLGAADHGAMVWDEIVGFGLAAALVPLSLPWLAAAFVVFRVLDILKPWPVRWVERRARGGLGVMLDDLVAGALTLVLLWIAEWLLAAI